MRRNRVLAAVALVLLLAGGLAILRGGAQPARDVTRPLGLFTSLPILWSEQDDLAGLLAKDGAPHWARAVLERQGALVPLDTLQGPALAAGRIDRLVMAQPRPLSPEENVDLDAWVRAGGRVLIFADPMLTQESAFALGDRRRPQDVVLLSPILARWGLELRFDDGQQGGLREIAGIPVNLPGQFLKGASGAVDDCRIERQALVARCAIGKGRATIVADAALLEPAADADSRRAALETLLAEAFSG